MARDELNNEYFEWLYQFVCDERYTKGLSYRKHFVYFHSRSFEYSIAMDSNRAEDDSRSLGTGQAGKYSDPAPPCEKIRFLYGLYGAGCYE